MKKSILMFAMILATMSVSAQFYVSASGGYSIKAGEKKLGSSISTSGIEDLYGSYGEGVNTQLRGGYFFNDKFGVELGVGYLYGFDQDVQKLAIPGANAEVIARGRAFGASLGFVYNITKNFYARAGYLTKIGGKTEAISSLDISVPAQLVNPSAPANALVDLKADFTTDFQGKFPSGFIGALGYKFPVTNNWSLFAEIEYMGINVTRDTSNSSDFSASIAGNPIDKATLTQILGTDESLQQLIPLYQDDVEWGKNGLPAPDAPYSSIGINVGFTYTFGK